MTAASRFYAGGAPLSRSGILRCDVSRAVAILAGGALSRSVSSIVAGAALFLAACALFVAYLWAVGLGLGGN